MPITPAAATAKWKAAMASGTARQNYIDGINNTTVNPMAEAASPQAMAKYQEGVMASITSGYRIRKLNAASPAMWKQNAVNFGAGKLASGAQKAEAKYAAFATDWAGTWEQMRQAAKSVQGTGVEAAIEKVRAVILLAKQKAGKVV